jgi:large subunit ribosomal protein L25
MIPAVIYGGNEPPLPISVPYKILDMKIHAGRFLSTPVMIDIDGQKQRVIPRDFQLHPVRDTPVHVDFLRIGANARINLDIPVEFINDQQAPGIKRGGVLNVVRHTVELIVPADAIPDKLVVDLTGLEINDSVHISKVDLPEGVTPVIRDRDFTIATVAAPAGFKDESPAAAAAPAAPAAAAKKADAKK